LSGSDETDVGGTEWIGADSASPGFLSATLSVGWERGAGPELISIARLRRLSSSSRSWLASNGADENAEVETSRGSAGGDAAVGRDAGADIDGDTDSAGVNVAVGSETVSVTADVGGVVGSDTGSAEREALLCPPRNLANNRLNVPEVVFRFFSIVGDGETGGAECPTTVSLVSLPPMLLVKTRRRSTSPQAEHMKVRCS
jgi:hypothetical protein